MTYLDPAFEMPQSYFQHDQEARLHRHSPMDASIFPHSDDLFINVIDPRLEDPNPNVICGTGATGCPPYVDPSQLLPTSGASQPSPFLMPQQPEPYMRPTSPLSWTHSSPMSGSDAVIDASQGTQSPGISYRLSPRPAPLPMHEHDQVVAQDLLGLGISEETDRGQQSQYYPLLYGSPYPEHLTDFERRPTDFGVSPLPGPPSIVHTANGARPTKRRSPARTSPAKRPRTLPSSLSQQPKRSNPVNAAVQITNTAVRCTHCPALYTDKAALEEHIRIGHNRPFICVFHFAGCQSSFTSKNEWKRHVNSQHIQPIYYLCLHESCADIPRTVTSHSSMESPQGKSFNRKDLYDQHVKRLHTPMELRQAATPEWKERTAILRQQATRQRCTLPFYMKCPASTCDYQFDGEKAWDERMEHVARHMEKAAVGEEPVMCFGYIPDKSIVDWAETPGVDVIRRLPTGGWELCNQAKRRVHPYSTTHENSQETDSNEDAEADEF